MAQVVQITFGGNVTKDTVASWVMAIGACGLVSPAEGGDKDYHVTVRRAGAMEFLQTLLVEGEKREVLSWQLVTP